jgi:1-acyl-sn-glycerol-3-phosphate acyltransferase
VRPAPLRAAARLAGFAFLTGGLLLVWLAARPLGAMARRPLRRLWCRAVCGLLGIRLVVEGTPFRACPTLFVPNHVSYLDIPVLGAMLDATFVAKAEVARWPLLGFLARLTGTMFVRRHWREAKRQRDALAARMASGESFVLFAEGTSSDGLDVLPLKSSLFSVAEPGVLERPIAVQPVVLAWRRLSCGTPIDATNAELYAWWGEATLLPHLWRVLQLDGVEVAVRIDVPRLSWSVTSRKLLAAELRAQLRRGLAEARAEVVVPGTPVVGAVA